MLSVSVRAQVAVVGCGYWGRNLVRNFADLSALSAVCDPDPATAARMSDEFSVPTLSFAEVLDSDVAAVAIAAPAAQHARLAGEVLEAGKDAFVEKPLALDVAQAESLVQRAEDSGRIIMVGHLMRYHSAFIALMDLVGRGDLGELRYVYSTRLNLGKVRREENILWSFAPHDISMILALADAEPSAVSATGAAYLNEKVVDVTTTHLAFDNGLRAHVFVSWLHPFKEQRLVAIGDSGMAVLDDGLPWDRKLSLFAHSLDWSGSDVSTIKAQPEPHPVEPSEPLREECDHFLRSVEQRTPALTDGHEGLRVLRVLEAAQAGLSAEVPSRLAVT